jgi:molybdopterin-guanine dinucleotide biosynthesis protein A
MDHEPPKATAIILAGGSSRRMGTDKGLLPADGTPLIGRIAAQLAFFPERLVGANDPHKYAFLRLPVIPDRQPGLGPLMGILSCVERAAHPVSFVTGCDVPWLDRQFVLHLLLAAEGHDLAVPRLPDGRTEPLLAAYRQSIVPVAASLLAAGARRVTALLEHVRVRYVPFDPPGWYRNLNTMDEYRQWLGPPRTDRFGRPCRHGGRVGCRQRERA